MTIAQVVIDTMRERQIAYIWFGATDLLDQCSSILGYTRLHPSQRAQRILNALEKCADFQKGYMRVDINGYMRTVRCFKLCNKK